MKTVWISGASTGIGKAAALRLAGRGYRVIAGVRKQSDIDAWKSQSGVRPVLFDVTSAAQIRAALEELAPELEKSAELHLVNNAGIAVAGPIEGVPLERWNEQFDVNVFGLVRATQALLPWIRRTKGRVVNISSVAGLVTSPFLGPYSASKYAVEAISDALRRELVSFGCRVVIVEPGPIATPIWEKNLGRKELLLAGLPPALQKVYGSLIDKFERSVRRSADSAAPVERVSDVIERALTDRVPRIRYVVGPRGLPAQMKLLHALPDRLVDTLIGREFRD